MARVKRATNAHKKRKVVLERASGYRGQRSRLYRKAKEQVLHSMTYAYRDRKDRKGNFRRLWIQRINAAARANGMTYNRFVQGLRVAGVEVDRRMLAELAFADASVDPYNGKCVRASAGSLFHLPVVAGARLEDTVGTMRAAGLRIVAADGRAGRSLDDPDVQARLAGPTAWMFGNEAWGLPPELVALADEPVAVPIYGRAESLNLAAAAAVCLYASARAQRVQAVTGQDGT